MNSRRVESFSDGVFAVAITVLVFNLLTIATSATALTYHALGHAWPQYAAYAVGFLTIGIMWMNHHTMLAHVTRVDRTTLVLNVILLMTVVAVPFTTALVADQLRFPRGGQVAAVSYGVLSMAMGVAFSALWSYLTRHQESLAATGVRAQLRSIAEFGAGLVGYIAGVLVAAFISATVALAIYGLVGVYYLFEHLPAPAPAAEDAADPALL